MTTKRRELRKVIQGILDSYGTLCTIMQDKPLCDTLSDGALAVLTAKRKPRKAATTNLHPIARALSTVCIIDFDANRGKLFAEAKRLSKATPPPTRELILAHYAKGKTWYNDDWRGKKGNAPTLGQVRLTWAKLVTTTPTAAPTMQATFDRDSARYREQMLADPQYQLFHALAVKEREAAEREAAQQTIQ